MLERLRKQKVQGQESAGKVYHRLIQKLGRSGALTPAEEAELDQAAQAIGRDLEAAEADAKIVATEAALANEAGKLPGAAAAVAHAQGELDQHNRRTLQILSERDAQAGQLLGKVEACRGEEQAARQAEQKLKELRREHWQLLNAADPVELAKRAHLRLGNGPPEVDGVRVVSVWTFLGPDRGNFAHASLPACVAEMHWLPLPGQSETELRELVGLMVGLTGGGKNASGRTRFLGELGVSSHVLPLGEYTLNVDAEARSFPSRTTFCFTRKPGQSQEEFERCLAKYRDGTAKEAAQFGGNLPVLLLKWSAWEPTATTAEPRP